MWSKNDKKAVKLPLLEIADSKSSAQINTAKSESFKNVNKEIPSPMKLPFFI